MIGKKLNAEQKETLWREAEKAGISRRRFLLLLSASGATAVLSACTAQPVTETVSVTSTRTTTATTTLTSATTVTPPGRLADKPVPPSFFIPIGGGNYEMRFEDMLGQDYVTPNSLFFIRSHASSQFVDIASWKLSIEGDGITTPMTLTYDDLLKLPATTVTRYVECAGNGRSFYDSLMNRLAQGGQWHLGGWGVARWTGVRLSEVLTRAGIKSSAVDVMPVGLDSAQVARPIPVSKAMQDDTLLAYMMNGDILPIDHGFPVRVLTPGWIGVCHVKWVGKIVVSTTPLFTDKNTTTYVLIGPDYQPSGQSLGPVVTTQVMKSALCLPWPAALKAGTQKVTGYAWSPSKITAVDVSIDGGQTFQPATLTGPNIEGAGTRWEFLFTARASNMTITPRATDDSGAVQYPVSEQRWNQLGYIFGAMVPHPVTVS